MMRRTFTNAWPFEVVNTGKSPIQLIYYVRHKAKRVAMVALIAAPHQTTRWLPPYDILRDDLTPVPVDGRAVFGHRGKRVSQPNPHPQGDRSR